ncbi:MAG: sodium:solute symporter [Pseudohongiellaceae bacterium]
MHYFDWIIVLSYLAYVIWHGLKLSRGATDSHSFFLAGRSLPWWAVGLSVMATQMSAITLIGTTGQAFEDGMGFIQFYFGLPVAMIILCVTAVPFFYRAKVFTAYEYLEKRFDSRTRTLTSFFFLVSRGLGVGVIIAAPAVILSIVLGWGELITIFVIGLSTTFYTMMGGVQAVTWTDVKQMVIIMTGLAICVLVILRALPVDVSLNDALFVAGAAGKLETIDFSFDLTERYTFWSGMIAAMFLFLSYFGCDQSQVQRYLTARSEDESRTSLLMSAFLKIPLQFLILFIGVLVFVFYQFVQPPMVFNELAEQRAQAASPLAHEKIESEFASVHEVRRLAALSYITARNTNEEKGARERYIGADKNFSFARENAKEFVKQTNKDDTFNDVNYVFPRFVLENMPIGVVGLIVAAILAAAMSSVAAELNSLATTSTMDIYRQHIRPNASEKELLQFGRLATMLWGVFACIVATFATNLGSLIEVVNTFGSFFYGSLLGVFVLAFMFPSAKSVGAFYGLLLGMASVWIASYYTDIAFLWFNVVGCFTTIVVGYLISSFSKKGT